MASEQGEDRGGVDRGTVVESLAALRAPSAAAMPRHTMPEAVPGRVTGPADGVAPQETRPPAIEPPFLPAFRPPVPRLTILDDGEPATGQTVWLRDEATVIGRTEGEVRLPHDLLVSARHAEIVRQGRAGAVSWLLRDLGSTNGTFVACTRAPLRPDRLLLLGGRRYQFRPPAGAAAVGPGAVASGGTLALAAALVGLEAWPALVEFGRPAAGRPVEIPLRGTSLVVGAAGGDNDIAIDDPLVAPQAARIFLDSAGAWHVEARPSRNGLWMQVMEVGLTPMCRFQVGEQRFLFVV